MIGYFQEYRNKIKYPRFLVITFLSLTIVTIAGLSFFVIDPVGFRTIIFQPIRELTFFQKELSAISHWNEIERILVPPPQKIHIPMSAKNKLQIVADLRVPEVDKPAPGILLLHGSSASGRRNGLIQLLSLYFQKAGWVTLAPDARGFGESEDPVDINNPRLWVVKTDVRRNLDYLSNHPKTDPNRIYVLGHSMGASHALESALDDQRVRALLLIGPPRYLGGDDETFSLWQRTRFSADRRLSRPVAREVIREIISLHISLLEKGRLKELGHKPILFIDGELEGDANLNYLASLAKKMSPPVTYLTLAGTGHYCGVYDLTRSDYVYYRPDLFNRCMKSLLDYFYKLEAENL